MTLITSKLITFHRLLYAYNNNINMALKLDDLEVGSILVDSIPRTTFSIMIAVILATCVYNDIHYIPGIKILLTFAHKELLCREISAYICIICLHVTIVWKL